MTAGDIETAARLLARAKSLRVFPLLKKYLPEGARAVMLSLRSVEVQWCPIHLKVLDSGKCQKQVAFSSPLEASL